MADPYHRSDKKLVISTGRHGERKTYDINKEQRMLESFKETKDRLIAEHRKKVRGQAATDELFDAAVLEYEIGMSPKARSAKHKRDLEDHRKKKGRAATLKTKPRRK